MRNKNKGMTNHNRTQRTNTLCLRMNTHIEWSKLSILNKRQTFSLSLSFFPLPSFLVTLSFLSCLIFISFGFLWPSSYFRNLRIRGDQNQNFSLQNKTGNQKQIFWPLSHNFHGHRKISQFKINPIKRKLHVYVLLLLNQSIVKNKQF